MPKFRSITLSIVSQWELRLHPEFPHPQSQKFRVSNSIENLSDEAKANLEYEDYEEEIHEYSYLPESRRPPQVSVYIPSCPGTRFWIRYAISPDHPPAKLFYFKLYMNGRHITSWGINPKEKPEGQIMRALFNPAVEENMEFAPAGIQPRHFYFAPEAEPDNEITALDGGLIEIKCYRASGRRQRAANAEDFRGGQKRYGLELPARALLDAPQDARFYDWILLDPKDEPYASFRFHYRAWENLVALSLIPSENPRTLISRSLSMRSITNDSKIRDNNSEEMSKEQEHKDSESDDESTLQPNTEKDPYVAQGYDEPTSTNDPSLNLTEKPARRPLPVPRAQPKRPTMPVISEESATNGPSIKLVKNASRRPLPTPGIKSTITISERPPTPFAILLDESTISEPNLQSNSATQRLLPIPPKRSQAELRRTPSTVSTAQSITPSLYSYVNREKGSESPEPIIGVAAAVPMVYSSSIYDENSVDDEGLSLFSVESPQRIDIPRPSSYGIIRPPEAMFSPEAVAALRQNKDADDYVPYVPPTRLPMATFYDDRSFKQRMERARISEKPNDDRGNARTKYDSVLEHDESTVGLAGDDWVLRTPSPVRKRYEDIRVRNRWSADADTSVTEDSVMDHLYKETPKHGRSRKHVSLPLATDRPGEDSKERVATWV